MQCLEVTRSPGADIVAFHIPAMVTMRRAVDCFSPRLLKACSCAFVNNSGIWRGLTTTAVCIQYPFVLTLWSSCWWELSEWVQEAKEWNLSACCHHIPLIQLTLGSKWGERCVCWRRERMLSWRMVILSGNKFSLTLRPPIGWTLAFYWGDAIPVECSWSSQHDREGLNVAQLFKHETTSWNMSNSGIRERPLVSWISRRELLCPYKQPGCVLLPGQSWWGSGYSYCLAEARDGVTRCEVLMELAALMQGHQSGPSVTYVLIRQETCDLFSQNHFSL